MTTPDAATDEFNTALNTLNQVLDPPIWVVTAASGARRGGLIATFVMPASITPEAPRMLVGLAKRSNTSALVNESQSLGLHLLRTDQSAWCWGLALRSGRDCDKLAGLPVVSGTSGLALLDQTPARLACRVESVWDIGDRQLYLCDVVSIQCHSPFSPLTFQSLIAAASPQQRDQLAQSYRQDGRLDLPEIRHFRAQIGYNNGTRSN